MEIQVQNFTVKTVARGGFHCLQMSREQSLDPQASCSPASAGPGPGGRTGALWEHSACQARVGSRSLSTPPVEAWSTGATLDASRQFLDNQQSPVPRCPTESWFRDPLLKSSGCGSLTQEKDRMWSHLPFISYALSLSEL